MAALTAVLTLAALAALCLGMTKHYRDLFGAVPGARRARRLRIAGWVLLALSFAAAIRASGWQIGSAEWIGLSSISGLGLALGLPRMMRYRDAVRAPPAVRSVPALRAVDRDPCSSASSGQTSLSG